MTVRYLSRLADLVALLGGGPDDFLPAERLHSRDAWLHDLERVHLALRSLPPAPDFDDLRSALTRYLDGAARWRRYGPIRFEPRTAEKVSRPVVVQASWVR